MKLEITDPKTALNPTGEPNYTFSADDANDIDGLGRLIHAVENISYPAQANRSHTLNYAYDMQSCLVDANITDINGGNWTAGYSYKKDGNIQQKVVSSQETEYSYNGDLMTDAGNDSLDWDENGRLTEGLNALQFYYNWDGKLRDVNDGSNNRLVSIKYDPLGNRVYKASSTQGTRKYIVDIAGGLPTILMEIDPCDVNDPNGSLKKAYIYTPSGQILAQYDCNGLDDNNEVVIEGKYFYIHDRLGSVRLVLNDAGDVNNTYTYSPFGEDLATEVNESAENPYKFTGQYFDSEIGQYYLRARMYDPVLMRFMGRDLVRGKFQQPLSLHPYLYCMNNSINSIDPSGEFLEEAYAWAKDAAASVGARTWAANKIATIATVANGIYSGFINMTTGPESMSDSTKFMIGFMAGAAEIQVGMRVNATAGASAGSLITSTGNLMFGERSIKSFGWAAGDVLASAILGRAADYMQPEGVKALEMFMVGFDVDWLMIDAQGGLPWDTVKKIAK